jgi:asparagine synthase (glutamine-hydrolysing)
MCGISAFLSNLPNNEANEIINKVLDSYAYRGPDGREIISKEFNVGNTNFNIHFGHLRLSIIDLSETGNQPMFDSTGRYMIVYNGELYNYIELKQELLSKGVKFKSTSDTEVLLELYVIEKENMLSKLVGMFSILIYDLEAKELFFARDPFGIKPLYYAKNSHGILFVSEPKSVIQSGFLHFEPNDKLLFDFLAYGLRDHTTETMFKGVLQIPSGHYGRVTNNSDIKIEKYWDVTAKKSKRKFVKENIEELTKLVDKTVELQLRSDVPVGTNLSGGLDSSIIATLASKKTPIKFSSFTASFSGEEVDETKYAKMVIDNANLDPTFISPTDSDIIENIENCIIAQGEPTANISMFIQFFVFKAVKNKKLKVILDGQGADELFLGYQHYFYKYIRYLSAKFRWLKVRRLLKNSEHMLGVKYSRKLYLKTIATGLGIFYTPNFLKKRLVSRSLNFLNSDVKKQFLHLGRVGHSKKISLREQAIDAIKTFSLPHLLAYEDRNAMYFSVESRVPYLVPNLFEFVYSFDLESLMEDKVTKNPLRLASEGFLPKEVVWRRKERGFEAPENKWFTLLEPKIKQTLEKRVYITKFIERNKLDKLLSKKSFENDFTNQRILYRFFQVEWWYNYFNTFNNLTPERK